MHTLTLGSLSTFLGACAPIKLPRAAVLSGSRVLALGDSLTYGTGATIQTSYPSVLAEMTGWEIINAGIVGEVSAQTRARLPGLLKRHQPHLVLTCIGTNDFTEGLPEETTRANVRAICEQVKTAWSQHMLIAVPPLSRDKPLAPHTPDAPLYQEIAQEMHVALQSGGLAHVLSNPDLRVDYIHPNAKGYAILARTIARSLHSSGLLLSSGNF